MRGRRHKLELARNTAGARAAWLRAARLVSEATDVAFGDIVAPARPGTMRKRRVRFARQAAIYLAVVACDVRCGTLARALGRPRVRILNACRRAEDARDDDAVDALFARLEAML